MTRDKAYYIRSWKAQLDAHPSRAERMTEEAWYSSFVGLAMRIYFAKGMTYGELREELE